MAILNYTTKITVSKTASQIQEILGRSGASNVSVDYRNGTPVAIMFGIEIKGKPVPKKRVPPKKKAVPKKK